MCAMCKNVQGQYVKICYTLYSVVAKSSRHVYLLQCPLCSLTSLLTHCRVRKQWAGMSSCTLLCYREAARVYWRSTVCHCLWSFQFCPPPAFPPPPPGFTDLSWLEQLSWLSYSASLHGQLWCYSPSWLQHRILYLQLQTGRSVVNSQC